MEKIYEFKNFNLTLKEYNFYVQELYLWYKEQRKNIENLYEELLNTNNNEFLFEIIRIQRETLINLIKKILEILNIDEKEFGVYLSNSYARGTNLLDSDIDINFVYDKQEYKAYEELISSMLASVYGKYRDFVHDSIVHHSVESDLSEDDLLKVRLIFSDDVLEYDITKGNRRLMDKLYKASNSREDFIKYYIERINNDLIDEWIYFQEPISGGLASDVLDYIKMLENGIRTNNIDKYLDELREEISKLNTDIQDSKIDDISMLKRLFKNHAYKVIYDYLILMGKITNAPFDYQKISELLGNDDISKLIKEYFKEIMLLGYICNRYGIEFRTRYPQEITEEFMNYYKSVRGFDLLDNLRGILEKLLQKIRKNIENYHAETKDYEKEEHVNIANYSPLSHINNISREYHDNYFLMPIIEHEEEGVPMHPDMFSDLGLDKKRIIDKRIVYPTSSTRTVYDKENNVCYKLPVLRQITRSIRSLSQKEIERSIIATKYLSKYSYPNFYIIPEEIHRFVDENYNYIVRSMPDRRVYPWFYLIVSNKFNKTFMMQVIARIIDVWFFYASKGIYFESFHTQNLLVDDDGNLYYRDLSDIRILEEPIMYPSYIDELNDKKELHSVFFDRSVLSQNLEHFIRYREDITEEDIELIKLMIRTSMEKYGVELPDYSMNYDKNRAGHHPIKVELVRLRKTKEK